MHRRFLPAIYTVAAMLVVFAILSWFAPVMAASNYLPAQGETLIKTYLPLIAKNDVCGLDPEPTSAQNRPLQIYFVSKVNQSVSVRNFSDQDLVLDNWYLCSITGNERAQITKGLVIPARGGADLVALNGPIWSVTGRDDVALYDPSGKLIAYWIDPS